jgi:hypothetical protein
MRKISAGLNRRQVLLLAVLFVADVTLLTVGWMIVREPVPVSAVPSIPSQANCQSIGAQLLAGRGLAGTARLDADGALRFELSGTDGSGSSMPRASEVAWDALAVAPALPDAGCGPYPFVRVDVPDPAGQAGSRLLVELSWIDLRAWARRELDDGELAARVKTFSYAQPEAIRP